MEGFNLTSIIKAYFPLCPKLLGLSHKVGLMAFVKPETMGNEINGTR